jgi:hypothetical protein
VRKIAFIAFLIWMSQACAQQTLDTSCYGTPFGANKVGASAVKIQPKASSNQANDERPGAIVDGVQPVPGNPPEVERITRGYKSGFVSAHPGANPSAVWFGIDLNRGAAYLVRRFSFEGPDASKSAEEFLRLKGLSWARKWKEGSRIQLDVVRYLPANVGATNFGGFICSANALWVSSGPFKAKSAYTDALKSYGVIVDTNDHGSVEYSKDVGPGDPVSDSVTNIQLWMK